jgi:hypothetical protein
MNKVLSESASVSKALSQKALSQSASVSKALSQKALSQSASVKEWLRGLIPVPSDSKGEPKKSADDKESQKA